MPGKDKTGPMGNGSRTGKRMGWCSGNFEQEPGLNRNFGRGNRSAFRNTYGWRNRGRQLNVEVSNSEIEKMRDEINRLKDQIELLENNNK